MPSFARCVLLSLLALPAFADLPKTGPLTTSDRWAQIMRMTDLQRRIERLRPRRLDTPLRELNLTDDEVREIQAVASKQAMNTMLNISPVITGCPCEEGPLCTDQVFIVATMPDKTVGLQLSRIRNAWMVGAVQQWWLRSDALEKRARTMKFDDYLDARNQLLLEFPQCALQEASRKNNQ